MMPRDANLSDSYTSNRCCFSGLEIRNACNLREIISSAVTKPSQPLRSVQLINPSYNERFINI